jgi:hypothetical protein
MYFRTGTDGLALAAQPLTLAVRKRQGVSFIGVSAKDFETKPETLSP